MNTASICRLPNDVANTQHTYLHSPCGPLPPDDRIDSSPEEILASQIVRSFTNVCIEVLHNALNKLWQDPSTPNKILKHHRRFSADLARWLFSHDTREKLVAMKKERFACRCDRTHPVINQLHFPHTPRGKCTTQEKTFLGFSTIVFTLMGTFLRQFDTHRANKLLAHPWFQTRLIDGSPRLRFKFKDAVYVGLLKPITKDQVSLFRTCILWFQDTKGPASMSFASTVTRYPNARLAFDKIVLEFPEITQELLKLLMEGVHVYLCNTGPERKTALDVHQELMVLLNRMAPLNPGGTWPKTYWRSQAPMILANIHHVVSELKKSPPPNWQQEMWPVKMIELVKAVYPWGVRRMLVNVFQFPIATWILIKFDPLFPSQWRLSRAVPDVK